MAGRRSPLEPPQEVEPRLDPAPLDEVPPRLVVIAYVIAAVCVVVPLAILGAGFAGAVLIRRGRPAAGAGVIAFAVLCSAAGVLLLR